MYCDSFKAEYVPQEVLIQIKNKSITHSISRRQSEDYITCRFYCIAFIEYAIGGKTLLDYANLFSLND